mmetsp:Transcript_39554/g.55740  ORF Transcript_39554/g.55740 Transcript_39554/m.55740 type:complete len:210 (+) Transcript_39554:203-832(+)
MACRTRSTVSLSSCRKTKMITRTFKKNSRIMMSTQLLLRTTTQLYHHLGSWELIYQLYQYSHFRPEDHRSDSMLPLQNQLSEIQIIVTKTPLLLFLNTLPQMRHQQSRKRSIDGTDLVVPGKLDNAQIGSLCRNHPLCNPPLSGWQTTPGGYSTENSPYLKTFHDSTNLVFWQHPYRLSHPAAPSLEQKYYVWIPSPTNHSQCHKVENK